MSGNVPRLSDVDGNGGGRSVEAAVKVKVFAVGVRHKRAATDTRTGAVDAVPQRRRRWPTGAVEVVNQR